MACKRSGVRIPVAPLLGAPSRDPPPAPRLWGTYFVARMRYGEDAQPPLGAWTPLPALPVQSARRGDKDCLRKALKTAAPGTEDSCRRLVLTQTPSLVQCPAAASSFFGATFDWPTTPGWPGRAAGRTRSFRLSSSTRGSVTLSKTRSSASMRSRSWSAR